MSAFVVGHVHINTLIHAALTTDVHDGLRWETEPGKWVLITPENADRVGNMLCRENFISVNHRYSESEEEPVFNYRPWVGKRIDPVTAIKAANCYEYQSCEHDGWNTSEAKAFIDALIGLLCHYIPGYDKAPWVLDDNSSVKFI